MILPKVGLPLVLLLCPALCLAQESPEPEEAVEMEEGGEGEEEEESSVFSSAVTVSCFPPASGEAPADYLSSKAVFRNYRHKAFKTRMWDKESKSGLLVSFLEPALTKPGLAKMQKSADSRRKQLAKAATAPLFLAEPKDPALTQSQYVLEVEVQSKNKKYFEPGAWVFELIFDTGSKTVSRSPELEWLEEKPHMVQKGASAASPMAAMGGGFSMGFSIPITKDIKGMDCRLYSGVKFNPGIPRVTLRTTGPSGQVFDAIFEFRYGQLPKIIKVPRSGGKGESEEWTWQE